MQPSKKTRRSSRPTDSSTVPSQPATCHDKLIPCSPDDLHDCTSEAQLSHRKRKTPDSSFGYLHLSRLRLNERPDLMLYHSHTKHKYSTCIQAILCCITRCCTGKTRRIHLGDYPFASGGIRPSRMEMVDKNKPERLVM